MQQYTQSQDCGLSILLPNEKNPELRGQAADCRTGTHCYSNMDALKNEGGNVLRREEQA